MAFSSPATVFRYNPNGTQFGPRLGAGILVVSAALSRDLLRKVAEDAMPPGEAIRQFEAEVAALTSGANEN